MAWSIHSLNRTGAAKQSSSEGQKGMRTEERGRGGEGREGEGREERERGEGMEGEGVGKRGGKGGREGGRERDRETEIELELENFILQGLWFRFSQKPV